MRIDGKKVEGTEGGGEKEKESTKEQKLGRRDHFFLQACRSVKWHLFAAGRKELRGWGREPSSLSRGQSRTENLLRISVIQILLPSLS